MQIPTIPDPTWHLVADLSRWNPISDDRGFERAVAAGIEGAVLRLSVGDYYSDQTYPFYYRGFKDLGIPVGAYVVTRPGISVQAHIDRALLSLGDLPDPDMWVDDAELCKTTSGRVASISEQRTLQHGLLQWMETRGKPVAVYTRATWWDQYVGTVSWASRYYAWMAHYYYPYVQKPYVAVGWNGWDAWQLGDKFVVDGVDSNVDLNFMKDPMFKAFKGQDTEPEPDPVQILLPGLYRVV